MGQQCIELYEPQKNTVNNAVKYADYALGQFIKQARISTYWRNTLFLIVADHNSRVYGAHLVPIERFHIPALILGADIKPAIFTPIASQIDLSPTLLSLIGISAQHPMIGHDLTQPIFANDPGRAIMQYYDTQAYLHGNQVIIMQKDHPAKQYEYKAGQFITSAQDPELINTAIAHSIWPMLAYSNKLYRLPQPLNQQQIDN